MIDTKLQQRPALSTAQNTFRPEPTVTPARVADQAPLAPMSAQALDAHAGASAFEAAPPVAGAQPITSAEALNIINPAMRTISVAAQRLENANAAVGTAEATLAGELAHLGQALDPEERGEYAAGYRAENQDLYEEASAAARALAISHREVVPAAVEAAAVARAAPGFDVEVDVAGRWLEEQVERGAQALETYVRQNPTADTALVAELEQTGATLRNRVVTAASVAEQGLGFYEATGARYAELAGKAGAAFGVVGLAADAVGLAGRFAEGDARAEHYVGAAAIAAQVGLGVATALGATITAPVTLTVGAVAFGASTVSGVRDANEARAAMENRLTRLGYEAPVVQTLAGAQPETLAALGAHGFDAATIQTLAKSSPWMVGQSPYFVEAFGQIQTAAGLSPSRTLAFLEAMGPNAEAVAGAMVTNQLRLGTPTTAEVIAALRPANPAFAIPGGEAAAAWLEANR